MNVPRGRSYGLESQLTFIPAPVVELGASMALLNTRYHGLTLDGELLPDRSLPHAPSWQAALTLTLHGPQDTYLRMGGMGRGSFYYDVPALDPYSSHAYVLLNVNTGIRRGAWSMDLWVRNATNRSYSVRGFFFGVAPPDFDSQQFTQLGAPRQFGATISYALGGLR
jgi:hypothetical protein